MDIITEVQFGGVATPGDTIFANGYATNSKVNAPDDNQINKILASRSLTTYVELKNLLQAIGQVPDNTGNNNQLAGLIPYMINLMYPVGKILAVRQTEPLPTTYIPNTTWVLLVTQGEFERTEGGGALAFNETEQNWANIQIQPDGLPNIEGKFAGYKDSNSNYYGFYDDSTDKSLGEGAFKTLSLSGVSNQGYVTLNNAVNNPSNSFMTFDASLSDSIYGSANDVRPKNRTIRLYKRTA